MNLKLQVFLRKIKKGLSKKWYRMMRPLASYLDKRDSKKYDRTVNSITREQTTKLLAKDIVKRIVKQNKNIYLIISDSADMEELSGYLHIKDLTWSSMSMGKKTKIGYRKFKNDVDFQLDVLVDIQMVKGVKVERIDENLGWRQKLIKGHYGTYKISIEGSKD